MKSIVRQFTKIKEKHPFWSSYICFGYTIMGKKISRPTLAKHFNKLVEADDYERSERKWLIPYLYSLTKHAEERGFSG